jgi:flagellar hook-length control protein FliK
MPSAASALFAVPSSNASVSSRLADRRSGAASQATFDDALGRAFDAGETRTTPDRESVDRPASESARKADRPKKTAGKRVESKSARRRGGAAETDETPSADRPSEQPAESVNDTVEAPSADPEASTGDVLEEAGRESQSDEAATGDDNDLLRQLLSLGSAGGASTDSADIGAEGAVVDEGNAVARDLVAAKAADANGPIEVDPALAAATSESGFDASLDAARPATRATDMAAGGMFTDESAPTDTKDVDVAAPDVKADALLAGESELASETEAFAELFEAADAEQPVDVDSDTGVDRLMTDPSSVASTPRPQAERVADSAAPKPPEPPPEARFAESNHEKIVSGVRGELLPNGGTMKLKLDPPELGSMQVSLHMRDGVVTASFQTSNDEATRLLSHTLSDLRASLEAQGIVVDRLHVQQAPRDEGSQNSGGNNDRPGQQGPEQRQDSRRDQQRKEMVQRLWDKLAGKGPLDLTA